MPCSCRLGYICSCITNVSEFPVPYGGKIWLGKNLANRLISSIWQKKVWRINRSANRILIVSTNLDGFSLVNHGWFTKFANFSPHQSSLYTVYNMHLQYLVSSSIPDVTLYGKRINKINNNQTCTNPYTKFLTKQH